MRIYEYLLKNRIHPTVDMIFNELVQEIPTLSRTTVYNTLKLFVVKGIVATLTIEENENRYDADTSDHGHFKCEKCGKVFDFELEHCNACDHDLDRFEIKERHVYFKGICKNCIQK